jgi:hypothetical protein
MSFFASSYFTIERLKMKQTVSLFFILVSLTSHFEIHGQQTVGLFKNDSLAWNGYTLFSSNKFTYLIDNCGYKVNEWLSNYYPGQSTYLLEDGILLRTARINGSFQSGGIGGRLEKFNWNNELIWYFEYADEDVHQHHDIEPLPNGNILLIAWERKTAQEAIEAGRNPQSIPGNSVWPDHIIEISPLTGNLADTVWKWHFWDHLIQDFDPEMNNYGVIQDHPELLDINYVGSNPDPDWIHLNAIDYNPELDQIIISSRHLNEIYVIDHSTTTEEAASHSGGTYGKGGDFLYRFGNPQVYQRGNTIDQKLFGQHDIHWIEQDLPGEGKLIVFNNGIGRPDGNYSSVDIFTPPIDGNGNYLIGENAPFGPPVFDRSYKSPGFFSSRISGAQVLKNGNILICEGAKGYFFEIDSADSKHWEYINPSGNFGPVMQGQNPPNNDTFRANRYSPDHPAFNNISLLPGDPVELNPDSYDCTIYNDIPSSANSLFSSTGSVRILQNPFSENIKIENTSDLTIHLRLYTIAGQIVKEIKSNDYLIIMDAADLDPGMYIIKADPLNTSNSYYFRLIKAF